MRAIQFCTTTCVLAVVAGLLAANLSYAQNDPYTDGDSPAASMGFSKSALSCPITSYAGVITSGDANQTGRVYRSGAPGTCDVPVTCSIYDYSSYDYDMYTFSNPCPEAQCYEAWLDLALDASNQLYVVAYLGSYDPTSVCTNFLADPGTSYPGTHFSFNVPAYGTFVLVVHRVIGSTDNSYTLYLQGLDNVAPTISVTLDPTMLWPPNHTMRTIMATVVTDDNCDGETWELTSITSNEPDNGLGDGDTENDIQGASFGTADGEVQLRAERSGLGTGRIYTLCYTATDASCNTAVACATVTVPHNMSKGGVAFRSSNTIPQHVYLDQNYPNPAVASTTFSYGVPEDNAVALKVYDLSGKEVATVIQGQQKAGSYMTSFATSSLPPGAYVYRLSVGNKVMSRTMLLTK